MTLLRNSNGRKIVMAASGMMMALFVTAHILGNASFFLSATALNAYAATLQGLGPFIWLVRIVMLATIALHVLFGIQLTLENRAAKPQSYAVRKQLRSTFASRTMIWSGTAIGLFLGFHLLHFTFHLVATDISAGRLLDSVGRPDVFSMMLLNFKKTGTVALYAAAVSALALHLFHGLESMMQTLGLSTELTHPWIIRAGMIAALLLGAVYLTIPFSVIAGIVR